MNKVICPECGRDITLEKFSIDSVVNGILDIGYECRRCEIDVYLYKVERMHEYKKKEM